ncbi:MAG: hypothetical protein ABL993_08575 [Vicinamibacterales bacterium]
MTHPERVAAVERLGFTQRQAEFLVMVMLHSGVCVGRQYCTFAGIVRGQTMVDFFDRLEIRRFATAYRCGHNKARVYHIHKAGLYEAIAQRDARFRKRSILARTIERLMILDHVVAHRELSWLGTEDDKLAHFLTSTSLQREELPKLSFGEGARAVVRYFPDKLPIGVSRDGRSHVLVYLLLGPLPHDFRAFLRRHAELLRGLPGWSVRLLVPTGVKGEVVKAYERAFREELAVPLHPQVAAELRWFYRSADVTATLDHARLKKARRAFGAPRFRVLQRMWLLDGDRVVDVAMSTSLSDAIARDEGRLECHELRGQYFHLSPLVGSA